MSTGKVYRERFALADEIAHCSEMVKCLKGGVHPCSRVVLEQWSETKDHSKRLYRWPLQHLLPEPWTGHIETAPLLFLASNPAGGPVSDLEPDYPPRRRQLAPELKHLDPKRHPSLRYPHSGPKWWWEREALADLWDSFFDLWVDNEDRERVEPEAKPKKPTKYWQKVRLHAQLLYAPQPVHAGIDYALTELVHCRSGDERGVSKALDTCIERYLDRVLKCSPAKLIVIFGDHGRNVMRERYPDPARVTEPLLVEGVKRRLVYLAHPCATKPRRPQWLTGDELTVAKEWLLATAPNT